MDMVITEAFLCLGAGQRNQKVLGKSEKIKMYLCIFAQRKVLYSVNKLFVV